MAPQAHGDDDERRDEELQGNTVGTLEPHNAPITLAAYDPDWPRLFDREADRLRSARSRCASSTSGRLRFPASWPSPSSTPCWSCPTRLTSLATRRSWRR